MMEKNNNNNNNTPRVSRSKDGPTITTTTTTVIVATATTQRSSNKIRFVTIVDDDGGIDCSGKYCKSCMAGLIADCVALCCCPCAVLHCFALAFVKAPWVVGRRCLGLGKNKEKKDKKVKRKCCKRGYDYEEDDNEDVYDVDVVLERNRKRNLRVDTNVVGEMDSVTVNAAFEAEKVWLELYQISHLDFGRVSYSHD